ncbi:ABATE domain-containing protein [Dongia sp.]|uniref:CGNR zinc finger domain-containing protein n=1 Tax=Dongia sp. TaxID=1977262 RepID=UPI0035B256B7
MSQIDKDLPARIPRSEFVAGRLALAFCNTVALPDAADRLGDPAGLAAWAARGQHPLEPVPDAEDLAAMLDLRDILRRIFETLVKGLSPMQADMDRLAALALPPRIFWDREAHRARLLPAGGALVQLRQAIIADAVDLLTGEAQLRIKRCPALDCRWFFFDTSRNATRRWCAMGDCGVKAKVQRYRHRHADF